MNSNTKSLVKYARSDLRTYRQRVADNKRNAKKSGFQDDSAAREAHEAMMAMDRAITELNEWLGGNDE